MEPNQARQHSLLQVKVSFQRTERLDRPDDVTFHGEIVTSWQKS